MDKSYNPKISIVIPVFNGEKYMKEAIDSALSQTYNNVEVIVVNDGSTDNTDEIAHSYGDKIRYIKKENGGVSSALNVAISNMNGEYFSWLSHDDRYYPNKIQSQIDYLKAMNYDDTTILYSDYDLMDEHSKVYVTSIKDHEELTLKPEYGLLRGSINGNSLLIPKKAFEDFGLFDENLKCVQDYKLWEIMQGKYHFIHQPEILVTTRLHKDQQGNTSPKMLEEGEPLWIGFIDHTPDETKKRLEGTLYNFYFEMYKFLQTTPYVKATEYAHEQMEQSKSLLVNDMKNIKISVIIPFYNNINSLCNAVNSVLNQTHKNFEILLINDGSTEDLSDLTALIEKNSDKTIKLISLTSNLGPANARNLGIDNATGDYIAFLDADDLFVEQKLEKQLMQMLLINSLFSHTSYIRRGIAKETIMNSGETVSGIVIPSIISGCPIATPTIMVHKDLYKKPYFHYDTSLRIGEDVCLYLSALRDIPVLGIPEPLTIVNVDENTCAYNNEKQLEGLKNIICYVLNDNDLSKNYSEISTLFQGYINIATDFIYHKNINPINDPNYNLYMPSRIKDYILLYKNNRPLLKKIVIYKLRNHPKVFRILRFLVRSLKKILGKKI